MNAVVLLLLVYIYIYTYIVCEHAWNFSVNNAKYTPKVWAVVFKKNVFEEQINMYVCISNIFVYTYLLHIYTIICIDFLVSCGTGCEKHSASKAQFALAAAFAALI